MKITQVEGWPVTMELAEPYVIAYEKVEVAINIFLRIESSSGIIGYGCAAPDEYLTGETPESVLTALDDIVTPSIKGSDPLRPMQPSFVEASGGIQGPNSNQHHHRHTSGKGNA
jgi:L-alanine-DL-glutamate epimerase-like enolase superfamily enzyme